MLDSKFSDLTGEVIENPDFLSTWIVHNPPSNQPEGADNDK